MDEERCLKKLLPSLDQSIVYQGTFWVPALSLSAARWTPGTVTWLIDLRLPGGGGGRGTQPPRADGAGNPRVRALHAIGDLSDDGCLSTSAVQWQLELIVGSQLSLGWCNIAQQGACSLTQWKDIRPWRPEFLKESILFLEIVLFFILGGCMRWVAGGCVAPCLGCKCAQKDGCAQRTGAHARPKPQ